MQDLRKNIFQERGYEIM